MSYVYIHKQVRNDWHCPTCRIYYISLYKTKDEALKDALKEVSSEIKNKDDIESLKSGEPIWIDEWARRSNGDAYQIFFLISNTIYDINCFDMDNIDDDDSKKITTIQEIKYMFINVILKKDKFCPDNIKFKISIHTNVDDVVNIAIRKIKSDYHDEYKNNFSRKTIKTRYKTYYKLLKKLESVWVSDLDNEENGNFYRIIELNKDKKIKLNDYCSKIQEKNW